MCKLAKFNIIFAAFLFLTYHQAYSMRQPLKELSSVWQEARAEAKANDGWMRDIPWHGTRVYSRIKEGNDSTKKQSELTLQLKPEIKKNDSGIVTLSFDIAGIDVSKLDKLYFKNNRTELCGSIPHEFGNLKFTVYPCGISYRIEFKKNEMTENEEMHSFGKQLPNGVDITTAKAETKNEKLLITLEPQPQTITIQHH